ncbi:hypothetical protein MJO29_000162, partial [Puccinia striiformis f. sp. tritici]
QMTIIPKLQGSTVPNLQGCIMLELRRSVPPHLQGSSTLPDLKPSLLHCRSMMTMTMFSKRSWTAEGGNAPPIKTTNQMKFSVWSKKVFLSTTAGLNEESISPYPRPEKLWGVKKQDPHPFLQFIFNYKPRSVLEDEGTVPKTSRPPEPPLPLRNVIPKVDVDEIIVVKKPKFEEKKTPKSSGSRIKINSDSEETEHQKVPKYESKPRRAKTENYQKAATDNKRSRSTSKVNKPGPKSDFLDLTGAGFG